MADDKSGRDKQAHDAEDRRQTRALVEELERIESRNRRWRRRHSASSKPNSTR